jgi:hypothetical protein
MVTNAPVISPPPKPTLTGTTLNDIQSISNYISRDLFNYLTDFYKHSYFIWDRTGGYNSALIDANEINVSAQEINSLAGISTAVTVQVQLNSKASIASLGTMAYQDFDSVSITGGSLGNVFMDQSDIDLSDITNSDIDLSDITNSDIDLSNITNSDIDLTDITNSDIQQTDILVKQGDSTIQMPIGGVANVNTNAQGNVGAGEDNLLSFILAGDSLTVNGSFIEIECFGTFASNANNKRVRLYFGSTVIYDTTSVAANSGSWTIKSRVIRIGSSSQKAISTISSNNVLIVNGSSYTTPTESLTGNVQIKCTGEAVANDDIVQEGQVIKLFNG